MSSGGKLIATRHGRVPASELGSIPALEKLHHAMQNDLALMRNFRRTNRQARLGPLSEAEVTNNRMSVPIHDHTVIDLATTSEEAREKGMQMMLVHGKLWISAPLPDDSWRDTMANVFYFLSVVSIVVAVVFLWKPILLWRLLHWLGIYSVIFRK